MKKIWEAHSLLVACSGVSVALLIVFATLQIYDSPILKLSSQWILVAGVPLLVALVADGYIKKFKGFGLELESKLQAPVASLDLKVSDAITDMPGDEKESVNRLHKLSDAEIKNIKRLSFVLDKKNYYGTNATMEYLQVLKYLEFIEVKKRSGEFVCLIPISAFQYTGECNNNIEKYNYDRVKRFITALEQEALLSEFSGVCVSTTVKHNEGLIGVLDLLRSNNSEFAIVISPEGKFIGTVTSREIEKRIADDVLYTKRA